MRELVYLSEAKLSQFLPDHPPWWKRLGRRAKLEVSTPVGKLSVEAGDATSPPRVDHLTSIIRHVEETAKWFGDPAVRSGEWVQFEALMSFRVVPAVRLRYSDRTRTMRLGASEQESPLFFIDHPAARPDTYGLRLLLHGSPKHLLGSSHHPSTEVQIEGTGRSSDYFLLDVLRHLPTDPLAEGTEPYRRPLRGMIDPFLAGLDDLADSETASWLAGYARVTTVLPARRGRVVGATPLFVERVPPPDDIEPEP